MKRIVYLAIAVALLVAAGLTWRNFSKPQLPAAKSAAAGPARSAIGWVIVGGMSFGTLFTLFVVPVAYTYIVGDRKVLDAQGAAAPASGH